MSVLSITFLAFMVSCFCLTSISKQLLAELSQFTGFHLLISGLYFSVFFVVFFMSESDSKRDSTFKVVGHLFLINF